MKRDEVLEQLRGYAAAQDSPAFCDALCDAAEYLGLPEGEYAYDDLLTQVQDSDDGHMNKRRGGS